MKPISAALIIVVFAVFAADVSGQNCTCKTQTGDIVDISSLGFKNRTARFSGYQSSQGLDYIYSFNPCYGFDYLSCEKSAICQYGKSKNFSYNIAAADSMKCENDGKQFFFTGDEFRPGVKRTSTVNCNCDPSAEVPRFDVIGEISFGSYLFTLTSKCCCPGLCEGSPKPVGKCIGTNGCFCKTEEGFAIDLSTVGYRDGTARHTTLDKFTHVPGPDGFLYSYNPCYPFNQLNCINSAACQEDQNQFVSYSIGDYSTATFYYDKQMEENHILYRAPGSDTHDRITDVTLVCDVDAAEPILEIKGQTRPLVYNMTLTTNCACPNGCEPNTQ